uniref:Uncharacterized protein n=1 Tax=viral metagenome TaxID=1070528 RepID=A0A6C0DA29_9ZZZZ
MSVLVPYKISSINLENIVYKKTKIIKNKKIIFIKYSDNNKLNNFVVQIPKTTNNIVSQHNEIEIPINNIDLINFLNKLDNHIISSAKESGDWFEHLDDKSSIDYQRILYNNDTDVKSIKLHLFNTVDFKTNLQLDNNTIDNFTDLTTSDTSNRIILEVYAVWIKSNSFGLLLRPVNISFTTNITSVYNYKFIDDSDADSDTLSETDLNLNSDHENDLFIKNNIINLNIDSNSNSQTSSDDLENDLNKIIFK